MTDESRYAIDAKHLTKHFENRCVVDDVSLQIKKGEVFGFLGPNGSGKTTTLRMLCGLLTPDAGEGTCLGFDILKQAHLLKQQTGYMTQHFSLYKDLTVYENLDFIARLHKIPHRKAAIANSIETLGISSKRQKQLAGQLSGGWKQRLALAATTLHKPQLLLLDEPTAGVDPKARREFWDEIHRLSSLGITTLVTTHYMDEAERCHRLAYISYGKLLTVGTMATVIAHTGLYTWRVVGGCLYTLANTLKGLPQITQVAHFGNALHISGVNAKALEETIKTYQTPPYEWTRISASLEDVFIHYSNSAKDNFA